MLGSSVDDEAISPLFAPPVASDKPPARYVVGCSGESCSERADVGCEVCRLSEDTFDDQPSSVVHAVFGAEDERDIELLVLLFGIVSGGMGSVRLGCRRPCASVCIGLAVWGVRDIARVCCMRDCQTIRTVCMRSSLFEYTQRSSLSACKHASTSALLPVSPASRNAAKKQPSRTSDASYWKKDVPRFRCMIVTTSRTTF